MTGPAVPGPAVGGVAPTLLDIYTRQVEMGGQLDLINLRLAAVPDHEQRLRALEAARWRLAGVAVGVSAVVSAAGTWLGVLLARH